MLDFLFGDDDRPQRKRSPRARNVRGLHTFTVEKPFCAPARPIVFSLGKYGIPITGYNETIKSIPTSQFLTQAGANTAVLKTLINSQPTLPIAQIARFSVPKQQAGWAEYLLWRTGKLAVIGGQVDGRNQEWARRHGGAMPPTGGRPWIEKDCEKGKEIWGQVASIIKKGKQKR